MGCGTEGFEPMYFAGELGERWVLAGAAGLGGFDDPIFEALEQCGTVLLQPAKDVSGEEGLVSAGLDEVGWRPPLPGPLLQRRRGETARSRS